MTAEINAVYTIRQSEGMSLTHILIRFASVTGRSLQESPAYKVDLCASRGTEDKLVHM
jgi:hypothetical protein